MKSATLARKVIIASKSARRSKGVIFEIKSNEMAFMVNRLASIPQITLRTEIQCKRKAQIFSRLRIRAFCILIWCRGPDSNRYGRTARQILSLLRLPIPPPRHNMERKTGFEPATLALARRCSTPEPLPLTSASKMVARDGIEPPTRGFSVLCSTD